MEKIFRFSQGIKFLCCGGLCKILLGFAFSNFIFYTFIFCVSNWFRSLQNHKRLIKCQAFKLLIEFYCWFDCWWLCFNRFWRSYNIKWNLFHIIKPITALVKIVIVFFIIRNFIFNLFNFFSLLCWFWCRLAISFKN